MKKIPIFLNPLTAKPLWIGWTHWSQLEGSRGKCVSFLQAETSSLLESRLSSGWYLREVKTIFHLFPAPALRGQCDSDLRPNRSIVHCTFFLHAGPVYRDLLYQSEYFNYVILCMILPRGRLRLAVMQKSLFTGPGWQKNEKHWVYHGEWKSIGCIMVSGVPREVPRPKPFGPAAPLVLAWALP